MPVDEELCRQRLKTLARLGRRFGDDCRNALTSIIYNADTLEGRYAELLGEDAVLNECHSDIAAAVQRLDETIGAWCYAVDDDEGHCDLDAAVERVESLVRSRLAHGGHRLEHASRAPARWVSVPPAVVVQVLLNLIDNSVEAARDPVVIRVEAEHEEGADLVLRVHDDGPGIAPPVAEHVFEPGFSTRAQAAGMGLPLAREALRRHGGDLCLGERALGASFRLHLPVALLPPEGRQRSLG